MTQQKHTPNTPEWNEEAYAKQKAICETLTDKGLWIALHNHGPRMTNESLEAYRDTLRERGNRI